MKIFIFFVILLILYLRYYVFLKIQLINFLALRRGLVTFNCFWYNVSEFLLKDTSGINLFYYLKNNYKQDFCQISMFGTKTHLLLNPNNIKYILDNSPYKFSAGILKIKFFNSFMKKNVGISCGCPWKKRREANENTLPQNEYFDPVINNQIYKYLKQLENKNEITFNDLKIISNKITGFVIFGEDKLDNIYSQFF